MDKLIKVTDSEKTLTGYQKVAILLGELGPEGSKPVLEVLNLKIKEVKKIRKELKKLGNYNFSQIKNEIKVLESVTKYGLAKGIFKKPSISRTDIIIEENKKEIKSMVSQTPDDIANVLRSWLSDSE